jgi:hypothetical protein
LASVNALLQPEPISNHQTETPDERNARAENLLQLQRRNTMTKPIKLKDTTDDATQLLRQRETELAKARADHAAAERARIDQPEATEVQLDALDAAVNRASVVVARAQERHRIAERRHEEALQIKAAEEREAAKAAAIFLSVETAPRAFIKIAEAYSRILDAMRDFAETELAVLTHAPGSPSAESIIRAMSWPEVVKSEHVAEMWTRPHENQPLPAEVQKSVQPNPDGVTGILYPDTTNAGSAALKFSGKGENVILRKWLVRTALPAIRQHHTSLALKIVLPELITNQGDIWTRPVSDEPGIVLDALDRAERELDRQIELVKSGERPNADPATKMTLVSDH